MVSGQYEKDILYLEYSNNADEKGLTTFICNERNLPYKAIWELEDGSRWSVNLHSFDVHGNLVKKTRTFSDDVRAEQTFTYDEKNRLTAETFWRSDGTTGNVQYHYRDLHDQRLAYADCNGLNGWFHGRIEYEYGSVDAYRPGTAMLYAPDLSTPAGRINYLYDGQDRLKRETWNFNSGFSQTFEYTYRDSNCTRFRSSNVFLNLPCSVRVEKEDYDYSGKGGGPSSYEYENNRLVRKIFIRIDGLKTITTYDYAQDGLLRSSTRKYADGRTGSFSYTYNQFGQLLQRTLNCTDGSFSEETYNYDNNGKLITADYLNFDNWLTGRLCFSHDRYDRITSAHFENKNGNHAEVEFTYNDQKLPGKIHWLFMDGTSQTYIFEYKTSLEQVKQ